MTFRALGSFGNLRFGGFDPHRLREATLRALTNRTLYLAVIGGLLFLAVFHWRYSQIPDHLYEARDDGVITMSHAKNLVDYGFIGVNPSGPRVEGYSAPVQMFAYALAYAATGVSYDTYARLQTLAATFALGALFITFFKEARSARGGLWAVGLTALGALMLSQLTSFIEWHGSGMENAITHALMLATLLILIEAGRTGRVSYWLAPVVFLASISRVEAIYYVGPMVLAFTGFMLLARRSRRGAIFAALVFGLWAAFNLWRYVYFGDMIPNTAYAQGISLTERVSDLLDLDPYLIERSRNISNALFSAHGGYLILLTAPLMLLHTHRERVHTFALVCALVFAAYASPFVFGGARLDVNRTTTHLAVAVVIGVALLIYHARTNRLFLWAAPALLAVGFAVFSVNRAEPYGLCCVTWGFDRFRQEFTDIAERESLPRPMVANPDLGVMSWSKQFNVVDLGKLGDPLLARLVESAIVAEYALDFAAPDMIEVHDGWSCEYDDAILSSPKFARLYRPVRADLMGRAKEHCASNPESPTGVWVRRDILKESKSRERRLIDDLMAELSVERVAAELRECQRDPGASCVYAARSAYRFLPEFRDMGAIDDLVDIFSTSRTREFDLYLITGYMDGQQARRAEAMLARRVIFRLLDGLNLGEPVIRSSYDVYMTDGKLVYLSERCHEIDHAGAWFFLHIVPVDEEDLPEWRKVHGFDNLDFTMSETVSDQAGARGGGTCIAWRDLPEYEMESIRTGQYDQEQGTVFWSEEIPMTGGEGDTP